ncbi:MAG: hypothetical protein ASARMPREDX12_001761 [Alectoria sarmentosa]|nr:MAG: hypothetical protein ASARMPREDX12_001761 [Alectoria sarmentosa]
MFAKSALAVVLLAGSVAAKTCRNMTVPVTISARTAVFDIAVPQTNLDATTFAQNQTQQGRNFTETALSGYATTAGTYYISAEFCMPSSMDTTTKPNLQILTHGIGFDKTYWDLSYNNFNYSYVDVATDAYKFCTLAYDRLGIGNSSHGEPLDEIQSFLEIAALAEMTLMLRNGTFPGVDQTFGKIIHVGHSFGSAQTYVLVNMYPTISDGIVLTGFSMNSSFVGYFGAGSNFEQAYLNQPFRFGNASSSALESILKIGNISSPTVQSVLNTYSLTDYVAGLSSSSPSLNYPAGYLTNANIGANQYLFFLPGFFDPGILLVGENTKQPVTVGELLTLTSLPMLNAFAGPVLIITGSNDLPYCGGNCLATGNASLPSIPAAAVMNFPNVPSGDFTAYIQPNSGHGINLHYNATGARGARKRARSHLMVDE